jgi:hypothetical protein
VHAGNKRFGEINIPKVVRHHFQITAAAWPVAFQSIAGKSALEIGDELSDHLRLRTIR